MTLPVLGEAQWVFLAISAFAIGLSKAGFSGTSMVVILLMASVLPARESTGAVLPMLILADLFAVHAYHRHANYRLVLRLLPLAALGIVCGWLLMPHIPAEAFRQVIGWLSLGLIVLVLVQKFRPALVQLAADRRPIAWSCGWLAGVTTMLANAAGPVMSLYLLACKLPKMEFVGTSAWFFLAVNLLKVPFSASMGLITPGSLTLNLCVAPLVIGGLYLGKWLLGKVNQPLFEWIMIVLSALGALRLVFP